MNNLFKMKNEIYDVLKFIALTILPALEAAYIGLAKVWDLPYGTQIPATIAIFATFLGSVLMISTKEYNKRQ